MEANRARARAQREAARRSKVAVVEGIHSVWRAIEDLHQSTTDASELVEDGLLDDYLTQAIADLAAVQEEARHGLRDLARLAVEERNLSARSVAPLAGVTHNTILKWLSPDD